MAKELGRKKSPNQLKAEIARSRDSVERDFRNLRSELDIPRKIRRSFQRQTGVWIIGVAVIGVLVATRLTRKKKIRVEAKGIGKTESKLLEAGFALSALRIAATFLKPMIVKFVTGKIRDYASGASSRKKW
jgi:hypothetical protein